MKIKIVKYYCPKCDKFKNAFQTTDGFGEVANDKKNPAHCRHCGSVIVGVTEQFLIQAVRELLEKEKRI